LFFHLIGLYTEINAQAIQGTLNNLAHTKLSHGDNFNRVSVISHRHMKVQRLFKERVLTYMVGPAKPSDTFSGKDYGHFSTQ